MQNEKILSSEKFIKSQSIDVMNNINIDKSYYDEFEVKRGLRNADGTGVMTGITRIGNVRGYYMQDGEKVPIEGKLFYRGIDVEDLITGFTAEDRFGFEETAYLILFGSLPDKNTLAEFEELLAEYRSLPDGFTEEMILAAPSVDIMNKLARSILALYSYDESPEPSGIENELKQVLHLIARGPVIVANALAAKRHYYDNESLHLHRPNDELSTAENFLYMVRSDNQFTKEEARLLDLCLVLHAEHGGGNNSAFSCRVLSSSGTDVYSSVAAAVGALKGPRHGGANKKVMDMFADIEKNVSDWSDEDQVRSYLEKLIRKEAGDKSGLIYGMGHAVYTMSDPRAVMLKKFAKSLAIKKDMLEEFELIETVERLTPEVFAQEKSGNKCIAANVDMYSGLVYKMLGIPEELYTPLFAIARMVGWCSHRIEEVYNNNKIIRPAYKAIAPIRKFIPLDQR